MVGSPPTKMVINQTDCPSSYRDNGLSATLVVLRPTQTIVYQPQWLILLYRRWFYQPQCLVLLLYRRWFYQPRCLFLLLQRQWFINHIRWSSSYTDNYLSTTMVGLPPTQTVVYQPVFYTGNCLSTTMDGPPSPTQTMILSTTLVVPPSTKKMVFQPHWLVLLLHTQCFVNHTTWSPSCIYNG